MESTESRELKLLFIQEALSQHGEWLADELRDALEYQGLEDTGILIDSIQDSPFTHNGNPGLRLQFQSYGRAFEITGDKSKRQRQREVNTNKLIWGAGSNADRRQSRKRKNTRWYARNMYGGLNKLIGQIMYGLSDYEIARLKGILENRARINGQS